MNTPNGTTHYSEFYGNISFHKKVSEKYLNQVSEQWQNQTKWYTFDNGKWQLEGSSFSPRRCIEV